MKLLRTVPLAATVLAVLSACAQTPAANSTPQPSHAASGHNMSTGPASQKMAMMDTHMKSMRDMHDRMMRARSPDERQAMRAEHMKMMQDGMAMMGGMGPAGEAGGMKGMHAMGTMPSDIEGRQQMMEKHMELMHSMMQMMIDQIQPTLAKP